MKKVLWPDADNYRLLFDDNTDDTGYIIIVESTWLNLVKDAKVWHKRQYNIKNDAFYVIQMKGYFSNRWKKI